MKEYTTITNKEPESLSPIITKTNAAATVEAMLQQKFPGKWKIINDSIDNWPKDMYDYFIAEKRKINPDYPYVSQGDFNADSKPDYAALVVNNNNKEEQRIAIFLDSTNIIIWNDDVRGAAIETHPKKDVGDMNGRITKLKSEAVNVEFFEKSSWVLYWNGLAFKKIWTGD